ncbi:MAG TPA: hypothetical protein DEH02_03590 [Bacteroidales bacterium]|nr:MAG: hypothetical protein A2X01_14890 [Bacteroidetes bacterium GWF2_35_48]HBX50134.1 hypothetical protein [Bacteroidales bacterium]
MKAKTKIISFHNQKGGCGKSTLTVLTANSLSQDCDKKVLVIDIDMQYSIYNTRQDNIKRFGKEYQFSYDIEQSNIENFWNIIKEKHMHYDVILLDLPGLLTISPTEKDKISKILYLCDIIIIPVKPGIYDIKSSITYFKTLGKYKELKQKKGGDIELHCLINMRKNNRLNKIIRPTLEKNNLSVMQSEISDFFDYEEKKLHEVSILKSSNTNPKTKNEFRTFIEELENMINQ